MAQAYDLDAMWSARTQYINLQQPSAGNPQFTTLYLTVFKFDPSYRQRDVTFQIDFGLYSATTRSCDTCTGG